MTMKDKRHRMKKFIVLALAVAMCSLVSCRNDQDIVRQTADEIFDYYKAEFKSSGIGMDMDFLDENAAFRNTHLYALCQSLPKGADLHLHADALLPIPMQVEFIADHPSELVVDCRPGDGMGMLRYIGDGSPCPEGYMTMSDALASGLTVNDFVNVWTFKGIGSQRLWDWFEEIFEKNDVIAASHALREDYYTRAFNYYIDLGVTRVEVEALLFGTEDEALEIGRDFYRAMNKARRKKPTFSAGVLACGLKAKTDSYDNTIYNDMLMDNAISVYHHLKDTLANMSDFVVGIDFYNEEDLSVRLAELQPLIDRVKAACPGIHLTLHAGESMREDNDEIRSAISLGAERIGHGFNLYRHEDLKAEIIRRNVTLSVCPISNHVLGYCPDLSRHPARDYIRDGIRVTISDDDPAYMENVSLVDDIFAAVVCWDLSLADLRSLMRNSIEAAFMSDDARKQLMAEWESQWADFESQLTK